MFVKKLSLRLVVLSLALFSVVAAGAYVTGRVSAASLGLFAPAEPVNVFESAPPATEQEMLVPGTCDGPGPIDVEATLGAPFGNYTTLGAAFAAINAGTHQGIITIEVCGNTTEPGPAVLHSSGFAPVNYVRVTIQPLVDGVTISGATVAGRGLVELNGADNVIIDGDNPLTPGINRNLTFQNTAAATTNYTSVIRLAVIAANPSADNNTIQNCILLGSATGRNISTATSTIGSENTTYGIYASGAGATPPSAPGAISSVSTTAPTGTTFSNLLVRNNEVATAARGIAVQGAATSVAPGLQINGNLVGNPTAAAVDQVYSMGITAQGSANALVTQNSVYVESFLGSGIRAIDFGAISTGITTSSISANRVFRVRNNNPTTYGAYGISLAGGNGHQIINNFVMDVANNQTSGTGGFGTTFGATGIRVGAGLNHQVYHNSVHMTGNVPGTTNTNLTAAFMITATTLTGIDVRNNIFSNQMTGGNPAGTRHACIFLPSGGGPSMNLLLNYNDYFEGPNTSGPLSLLGQVGVTFGTGEYLAANFNPASTSPATNFRAYSSTLSGSGTNDNESLKVDPEFVSSTDLHVLGTSPVLEEGDTIATVSNDIDFDLRPIDSFYDIGADERAVVASPGVLQLSATAYGGIEGGTATITVNRVSGSSGVVTVDVDLADVTATGGPLCGGAVDYINPGTITLTFPNLVTTQSFSVTLCSDLTSPEPLETFTATLSNPTGGATLGTPTVATVTITDFPPPFAGTYTVGTGGGYPSLTNPGGIFEAINLAGTIGPVTIEIVSDLSGETGTHPLNEHANPITIKPVGAPRTISGNSATAIIKLNGSDDVTINGSIAGLLYEPEVLGGNPAIRELTIQNANATGAAIWIATNATSGATNNTIKNLNIVGPGSFGGQGIIAGSGTTFGGPAELGRQNSFNTIRNISVTGVLNAVFTSGNATTLDQNWLITENEFGSTVPAQKLSFRGVAVLSAQTFTISENRIFGISSSPGSTDTMSGILVGGVLNGGGILKNDIRDIRQNNPSPGWGSNGIYLNATNPTAGVTVANNFVSDIASDGYNGFNQDDNGYGIMVNQGGQYGIWNNTIVMNTNQVKTAGHSSCINIEDIVAAGSVAIQNNILENRQTVGNRYGIIDQRGAPPPLVYSALSNNLYHNPTGAFFGRLNSVNHATLAAWQGATGLDGGSLSANPLFVSPTNFHITGASPAIDAGTTIPLVPDDIDNQTRPQGPAYDIGADESALFTVGGTVSGLVGTGLVLQNNGGDNLTITTNGPFTFATALPDFSTYNVTVLTQPTGPAQTCTVTNGTGTISGANVTNVQVTCVTVQWPLNVSLAGSGTGSVSSSPAGISCPGTCSANFNDSTLVTLTPTAGIGSVFAGWSGDCTGMGPCTVNMTAARNVTATFNLLPQVQFASAVFQDDESQSATITVTRSVDLTGSSSVDVTLTDATATGGAACTSGIDYINPGTVTLNFAPTVASQSFNVTLCGDTLNESLETVNLALSNPVNAFIVPPSTAILNINDTANQWRNPGLITINDGGIAGPYPSTITVSGAPTSIGSIRVTLYDVWHNFPDDINVLLVHPDGVRTYVLMADAGGPAPGIPNTAPVTLTFSDLPNPVVPDSTAPTTGKYLPTTWEPVGSFPGSAPPAPYPTPGNAPVSGRTVVNTLFGAFGLSDGNGVWSLYIVDDDGVPAPFGPESIGGEVLGGWGIELLPPTNTSVTVSGRVMTPDGVGLRNAVVSMTDSFGVVRQVTTSSLGYYTFAEVPVGDTYVMSVSSRRYRFTPRLVPVVDTLTDVDFIGQE